MIAFICYLCQNNRCPKSKLVRKLDLSRNWTSRSLVSDKISPDLKIGWVNMSEKQMSGNQTALSCPKNGLVQILDIKCTSVIVINYLIGQKILN